MAGILKIQGKVSDIAAGLKVKRLLPAAAKRAVGPFVFFDHMGPVTLDANANSDVDAHPHIGLATVTYLFDGSLLHRDSIGSVQAITPGDINWMTAGRGIVHSERTPEAERGKRRQLHGLQLWVALPPDAEEANPGFQHVASSDIPTHVDGNTIVKLLVGNAFGLISPVRTLTPTLYLDVFMQANSQWTLPPLAEELAVYVPENELGINGEIVSPSELAILDNQLPAEITSGGQGARFVVIGGAPLLQPVRMWWNYVSVDRSRIAAAAKRWEQEGFDRIPGDTSRILGPKWID